MLQQHGQAGSTANLIRALPLARSSFYYRPKTGSRGRQLSTQTRMTNGQMVTNEQVVAWIKEVLDLPFVCYGYEKITDWLRQHKHLIINKKKVYRLMKQARLLFKKKGTRQAARCVVEVRKMAAEGPNQAFQFDIKMYWVAGLGWVPCLSVIDIFTRQLKAHLLQRNIRQDDVKALWQDLLALIPIHQHSLIRVRCDNGSQFAAKAVRSFFTEQHIYQEFCHVATPEEDGFIESFHSIVERELVRRHEWQGLAELVELINRYVYFYNEDRLHGSLGNISPNQFSRQWVENQATTKIGFSLEREIAEELAIPVQFIGG